MKCKVCGMSDTMYFVDDTMCTACFGTVLAVKAAYRTLQPPYNSTLTDYTEAVNRMVGSALFFVSDEDSSKVQKAMFEVLFPYFKV